MPWLLLAGAALGLALSAWGLLEPRVEGHPLSSDPSSSDSSAMETLPEDAAAIVGGRVIRRVDYERMLAGVAQDLRNPIDDATRERVLERMIDEELLVQRALGLGLAAADRRVRGELVSGVVDSVVAEADGDPPSAADVERHFRANLDFFERPGRVRVELLFFSTRGDGAVGRAPARERLAQARASLAAGEDPRAVERRFGDPQVAAVPDVLLPLAKLRDYHGPALVEAIAGLEPGVWSEAIEAPDGWLLARVAEQEAESAPPLAEIEPLVRRDLVRKRGDEALRRYLDTLRDGTRIVRNEAILRPPAPGAPAAARPRSVPD